MSGFPILEAQVDLDLRDYVVFCEGRGSGAPSVRGRRILMKNFNETCQNH